jgi:hypothetical protein
MEENSEEDQRGSRIYKGAQHSIGNDFKKQAPSIGHCINRVGCFSLLPVLNVHGLPGYQ